MKKLVERYAVSKTSNKIEDLNGLINTRYENKKEYGRVSL